MNAWTSSSVTTSRIPIIAKIAAIVFSYEAASDAMTASDASISGRRVT
jgi:hypothetical protein